MAKKQTPQGVSLREAAAALGITRAKLLKMIDKGLPAPLVRERRTVDIEAARAWIAAHDAEPVPPTQGAQLHPDDARAIQAETAAKVKGYKLALDTGGMVTADSVAKVMAHALAHLNAKLNAIPSMVGPLSEVTRDNARKMIGEAMVQVLEDFAPDDPEQWQDSPFTSDAFEADPDEFEDRAYLPILPDSDPRAAVARVQTQKLRVQLEGFESSCIAVDDVRRIMREQSDKVRKAVNKIPGLVAKRLREGDPAHVVRDVLLYEIAVAKHAALIAMGAKPDWKPSPPMASDADESAPLDDVNGVDTGFEDEFEDA